MSTTRRLDRLEAKVGELLESHTGQGRRRRAPEFAERPVEFSDAIGRPTKGPHWDVPYQREIMRSVLENRKTVVRGCHACGKEHLAGTLATWAAFARGMKVVVISATEHQVIRQTMGEVREAVKGAVKGLRVEADLYQGMIRIGGEDRIIALTGGADVDSLTGWHDPNGVLIIISEGQGLRLGDDAYDAALGNAADELSRVLVMGNPVRPIGRFYEVNQKPDWRAFKVSAFDTPNLRAGRVVVPGFPSPSWPEEMEREYGGKESAYYVGRVLAEFPKEGSADALLRADWLEASYERHEVGPRVLRGQPVPALALDVARSTAGDENVAAIAQGARVHRLEAWHSRDLVETAGRFLYIADRARLEWYAATRERTLDVSGPVVADRKKLAEWLRLTGVADFALAIDAPGVGGGTVDACRRLGRYVTEFWGWLPATDEKRFANLRAETYWQLRKGLEDGLVALPRDEKLHEEALVVEWTLDARGRIIMAPKEDIRKALKRSPDRLDAVVMALAAASAHPMGVGTVSFPNYLIEI